ncbi:PF20097 family protein [Poriferisphaera sp. WC338]|uniref:PF20097 family protein n=1 Tax=Poriferisphaera sp. WC338 TaxID=3425129 RepID=UPI003D814CD3
MANLESRSVRCPSCHAIMDEGSLPVSTGLTWVNGRKGEGHEFAENLPGTHAVMRPNHVMAWRCRKCNVITFKYGKSLEQLPTWAKEKESENKAADEIEEAEATS